jgi:hypothetical protein
MIKMKKTIIMTLDTEAVNETIHFYEIISEEEDDEKDYIFSISGDTVYYFIDQDILKVLRTKKQIKLSLQFEIIKENK